jgi:hypothetical protein
MTQTTNGMILYRRVNQKSHATELLDDEPTAVLILQ